MPENLPFTPLDKSAVLERLAHLNETMTDTDVAEFVSSNPSCATLFNNPKMPREKKIAYILCAELCNTHGEDSFTKWGYSLAGNEIGLHQIRSMMNALIANQDFARELAAKAKKQ